MYKFNGFSFSGYRSVGTDPIKIYPLRKINFIIGKNNIGKSNIVKYLSEVLPGITQKILNSNNKINYNTLDFNIESGSASRDIIKIGFPLPLDNTKNYIDNIIHPDWKRHDSYKEGGYIYELFRKVLSSPLFKENDSNAFWFYYRYLESKNNFIQEIDLDVAKNIFSNSSVWQEMHRAIDGPHLQSYGYTIQDSINHVLKKLIYIPASIPPIIVVPAIRRVGDSRGSDINHGGDGIILQIAKLQNPELLKQSDKNLFDKINRFVASVLENDSARIEIPFERDMILVHMDDKVLPLEFLGTGVHEVIILAVTATIHTNTIICIEEPELHLHPLLQRKLIKYIDENTDNQYIFTTHSAHLLDAVNAEIFHISRPDNNLHVAAVYNNGQRSNICKELGYKASDILQANCIIWVEGPSDRIYVNKWIKEKNEFLIEGIHYSVMFYGGRLLSHLSANENESADDFICILKLNRNAIVILDSDKSTSRSRINDTKKRIIQELTNNDGLAWVTQGREVENYLNPDLVEECVLLVHPKKAESLLNKGVWDNILKFKPTNNTSNKPAKNNDNTANKVEVAKEYTKKYSSDFKKLDLEKRINEVISYILKAN